MQDHGLKLMRLNDLLRFSWDVNIASTFLLNFRGTKGIFYLEVGRIVKGWRSLMRPNGGAVYRISLEDERGLRNPAHSVYRGRDQNCDCWHNTAEEFFR
jgi:hypothetical protein